METSELAQRIESLEDRQLLHLLTVDAEQYTPLALELAEAEAARRNLAVAAPDAEPPERPSVRDAALEALKAVRDTFDPAQFVLSGKAVRCSHCDGDLFQERQVLLNTRLRTLVKLDWLDRAATALVCEQCGLIQWFLKAPQRR